MALTKKVAQRYLEACGEPAAQEKLYRLYALLDDIDTADDMAKGNDELYRNLVRHAQRERFNVLDEQETDALYDQFNGRTAGWWAISPEGREIPPPVAKGNLLNALPGVDPSDELYMGDGPADTIDAALDRITQQYIEEWGRKPTMTELDTAWRFCTGPYRIATSKVLTPTDKEGVYHADLAKDVFVHFTPADRAEQILASGKLLMNPPYKKFGPDAIYAVSAKWGQFHPPVQTTRYGNVPLVGILFTTTTVPKVGFTEEVSWVRDVVLNNPKVLPYAQAVSLINSAREHISDDAYVLYGQGKTAADAKYKGKKQIKNKDGDTVTVYEYSDRQIANRHREKSERLDNLMGSIKDLEAKLKKDLDSDDIETRLTALAVALIHHTYERVGNDDSAADGHFGVTGWLKKHVSFSGGDAKLSYVGKSGVKQNKSVTDPDLVAALKDICKGKSDDDPLFDCDDCTITSKEVNEYLKPFDVTAKDLRGYHANREMMERLGDIRADGPELPRPRKERDEILKAEFKKALEATAEAVGHEATTLRNQYLVPHLEESYMKDGTVIESLKKQANLRTASLALGRFVRATKTRAEKEDEQVDEKLVRRSPKKKPPREDLRDHRIDTDDDPDLEPMGQEGDRDLSLNYKRVAAHWLARHLYADGAPDQKIPTKEEQAAGSIVTTEAGRLRAKNKVDNVKYFDKDKSEEAKVFSEGSETSSGADDLLREMDEIEERSQERGEDEGKPDVSKEEINAHPVVEPMRELTDRVFDWDGKDFSGLQGELEALSKQNPFIRPVVEEFVGNLSSIYSQVSSSQQWQEALNSKALPALSKALAVSIKNEILSARQKQNNEQAEAKGEGEGEGKGEGEAKAKAEAEEKAKAEGKSKDKPAEAKPPKPKVTDPEQLKNLSDDLALAVQAGDEKDVEDAKEALLAGRAPDDPMVAEVEKYLKDMQSLESGSDKAQSRSDALGRAMQGIQAQEVETNINKALEGSGLDRPTFDQLSEGVKGASPEAVAAEFARRNKALMDKPPTTENVMKLRGEVNPKASVEDQIQQRVVNRYVDEYVLNPNRIGGGLSPSGFASTESGQVDRDAYLKNSVSDLKKLDPKDIAAVMAKTEALINEKGEGVDEKGALTLKGQQAKMLQAAAALAYVSNGGDLKDSKLPASVKEAAKFLPANAGALAEKMGDRAHEILKMVESDPLDSQTTESIRETYNTMSADEAAEFHAATNPKLARLYAGLKDLDVPDSYREELKRKLDNASVDCEVILVTQARRAQKELEKGKDKGKDKDKDNSDASTEDFSVSDFLDLDLDPASLQSSAAAGEPPPDPREGMVNNAEDMFAKLQKELEEMQAKNQTDDSDTLDEIRRITSVLQQMREQGAYDALANMRPQT